MRGRNFRRGGSICRIGNVSLIYEPVIYNRRVKLVAWLRIFYCLERERGGLRKNSSKHGKCAIKVREDVRSDKLSRCRYFYDSSPRLRFRRKNYRHSGNLQLYEGKGCGEKVRRGFVIKLTF